MTGEHVRENFNPRSARLLQHHRPSAEQEIGETQGGTTVSIYGAYRICPDTQLNIYQQVYCDMYIIC